MQCPHCKHKFIEERSTIWNYCPKCGKPLNNKQQPQKQQKQLKYPNNNKRIEIHKPVRY